MRTPTAAIITRTKNRPRLLGRAIDSVLAQTEGDWVHVIVNDCGEREPVERLVASRAAAYRGRVQLVHRTSSTGMESAANAGIAASTSRFVALLDDDDTWEPTFLARTTGYLLGDHPPTVRGVVTRSTTIHERLDDDGAVEVSREPTNPTLKQVTLLRTAAANVFTNHAFVYERAVFDELGGYREDLPVLGDWEWNVRFLVRHDVAVIPLALANYHQRVPGGAAGYANSVVAGVDQHRLVESLLRNEWLRADLAAGRVGLGLASGVGGMLVDLERRVLFFIDRRAADPVSVAGRAFTWTRNRTRRALDSLRAHDPRKR